MARHLSPHQKKIVKRYYDNHETIKSTKLSEIVSDLWLAEDPKTRMRLWGRAEKALLQLGAERSAVVRVVASDSAELLAKMITQLERGRPRGGQTHR